MFVVAADGGADGLGRLARLMVRIMLNRRAGEVGGPPFLEMELPPATAHAPPVRYILLPTVGHLYLHSEAKEMKNCKSFRARLGAEIAALLEGEDPTVVALAGASYLATLPARKRLTWTIARATKTQLRGQVAKTTIFTWLVAPVHEAPSELCVGPLPQVPGWGAEKNLTAVYFDTVGGGGPAAETPGLSTLHSLYGVPPPEKKVVQAFRGLEKDRQVQIVYCEGRFHLARPGRPSPPPQTFPPPPEELARAYAFCDLLKAPACVNCGLPLCGCCFLVQCRTVAPFRAALCQWCLAPFVAAFDGDPQHAAGGEYRVYQTEIRPEPAHEPAPFAPLLAASVEHFPPTPKRKEHAFKISDGPATVFVELAPQAGCKETLSLCFRHKEFVGTPAPTLLVATPVSICDKKQPAEPPDPRGKKEMVARFAYLRHLIIAFGIDGIAAGDFSSDPIEEIPGFGDISGVGEGLSALGDVRSVVSLPLSG